MTIICNFFPSIDRNADQQIGQQDIIFQYLTKPSLSTKIHLFNGIDAKYFENDDFNVEENSIAGVSENAISADALTVVDGRGSALMPSFPNISVKIPSHHFQSLVFSLNQIQKM